MGLFESDRKTGKAFSEGPSIILKNCIFIACVHLFYQTLLWFVQKGESS